MALASFNAVALEKCLELLEGSLHRDDAVCAPFPLEPDHGVGQGVGGGDLAGVEKGLEVRNGKVADEGAVGVNDGEVSVVALEGGEEGDGDGVLGGKGEGCGGVNVFYGGLSDAR